MSTLITDTEAVLTFTGQWSREEMANYIAPAISCDEVDALAGLLYAIGEPAAADMWVAAHARKDEPGDLALSGAARPVRRTRGPDGHAAMRQLPVSMTVRGVREMGAAEAQAFAAGYLEALHDHAADTERLAAQEAEIRNLQRSLTTAEGDLAERKRTVAALEEESSRYFQQLRGAGVFDAERAERTAAYRARQAKNLQRVTERLQAQRPDYEGGPVQWPEPL